MFSIKICFNFAFQSTFNMEKSTKHLEDISEIRNIMERSTKFLSLSGWSGIFAGIIALIGAIAAYRFLGGSYINFDDTLTVFVSKNQVSPRIFLLADALIVLFLALVSAFVFSYRKATKRGEKIWTPVTRRLLFQLAVPLLSGGALSLILIWDNHLNLLAPLTLIFYGLALVNAGKYTTHEIVVLGIAEIIMGLAAALWQELGLYFWAAGFGLFHIIYGIIIYMKYDRKAA